jgi:hypothetical protein
MAVNDVVTVAVKIEMITRPIIIQTNEKARAKNERRTVTISLKGNKNIKLQIQVEAWQLLFNVFPCEN